MGISRYLYPNGYINILIPLWVYFDTYTLMGTSRYLYPHGYIYIPITKPNFSSILRKVEKASDHIRSDKNRQDLCYVLLYGSLFANLI